jgi:hypothetical protein
MDHPIMFYSIDIQLEEYLKDVKKLEDDNTRSEILQEYIRSDKNKAMDGEIVGELINAEEVLQVNEYNSNFNNLSYDKLEYLQSAGNDLFENCIIQLVFRSSKVRIRTMCELVEEGLDDPFVPVEWIYHKNWKLNDVLNYIKEENDDLRKEDEETR